MTTSTNAAIRAIAPDVHTVRSDERFIYVESAGLSLHSFGPLEANQYDPPLGPRAFSFRIPRYPRPAAVHLSAPLGIIGVLATGVPIYNPIGAASYRDRNIWHRDAVAASAKVSALLPALTAATGRHSPIIGFALDGYPIYGPFGWDAAGNVRRMKSSYRLRPISRRAALPDGTTLTPAQEGPGAGPDFPPGAFAEDYEFVNGSGDLDEFNGRFAKTPEYPQGTYAYFLATTDGGAIAWPYLIGPRYFGEAPVETPARIEVQHQGRIDLLTDRARIQTDEPVHLTLVFHDSQGRAVRFLEKVHQQPVHLIVVSKDLAEFDHIHPEPVPGDAFSVTHTFTRAGEYWLYADYTAPGEPPSVARFSVAVTGGPRKPVMLHIDTEYTKTVEGIQVAFTAPQRLDAGRDLPLAFTLTDAANHQPIADLDPWLGAWGHIMIVGGNGESFIHAHPLESAGTETSLLPHTHAAPVSGPSPSTIRTVTGFRSAGIYKLWFQFQRHGRLITVPWVIRVWESARPALKTAALPADAIRVTISGAGFEPARLEIPAGKEVTLAFTRTDAQNCANEVVFPALGLREPLPPGGTVIIRLPARPSGELSFACGMGMYRGAIMVR
jgi:plastocyanin